MHKDTEHKRRRVIAISGTISKNSKTQAALHAVLAAAEEEGSETKLISLHDLDLVFAGSVPETEYPEDVFYLRQMIREADAIILGSPEYHGSMSGVLKNALDLMRGHEFEDKLVGLVGVAGGAAVSINVLSHMRAVVRNFHGWALPEQVAIAASAEVFDQQGKIRDKDIASRLATLGRQLAKLSGPCERNTKSLEETQTIHAA